MVKRFVSVVLTLIWWGLYLQIAHAQPAGLRFTGQGFPLDQRTSLNLTPEKPILFESDVTFEFDLRFIPNYQSYFGYVFRAIIDNQNIDLVYTTQADNFHLVIGDQVSDIVFSIPITRLTDEWFTVGVEIKKSENRIVLKIDGKEFQDEYSFNKTKSNLFLFFGAHRFRQFNSTDLPNMSLKDVKLFVDDKLRYSWPLDQKEGTVVMEELHHFDGNVGNPNWILESFTNWKLVGDFSFEGRILHAFNSEERKMEIIHEDSVYAFYLTNNQLLSTPPKYKFYPGDWYNLVYDSIKNNLVLYSLAQDLKCPFPGGNCFQGKRQLGPDDMKYKHHNAVINPENNVLYTFGGYGQLTYVNKLFAFNDAKNQFITIDYNGTFYPRYLAGCAYNPLDGKVYILGGYGSKSGKQEISPGYYYELLTYSFIDNRFEKIHEFKGEHYAFCFGNSMVIDTSRNTMIGLKFSRFETNPEVQAVAISLDDFSMRYIGNTFSFQFLDINSKIDLYYDDVARQLVAFTAYYDGIRTEVNIHQLSYPPLETGTTYEQKRSSQPLLLFILIAVLVLAGITVILLRMRRIRTKSESQEAKVPPVGGHNSVDVFTRKSQPGNTNASISIFGGFQVMNNEGKNITSAFTPLIKELFLFIMLTSLRQGKGVSSRTLDEVFWFDKSAKAAQNNRSVNIGRLKSLLENVGNCKINRETGYWKFEFNPEDIYCDYYSYLQLIENKLLNTKEGIVALLRIIQDGPALQNIQADWLDKFKLEISNEITDNIIAYILNEGKNQDPEFIIQMTDALFMFDMVNEEAMIIKCNTLARIGKHSLAKTTYHNFEKEYLHLYDEKYPKSFNQVLDQRFP